MMTYFIIFESDGDDMLYRVNNWPLSDIFFYLGLIMVTYFFTGPGLTILYLPG